MSYICHTLIPEHKGDLYAAIRCDSGTDRGTCCHLSAAPSGNREAKTWQQRFQPHEQEPGFPSSSVQPTVKLMLPRIVAKCRSLSWEAELSASSGSLHSIFRKVRNTSLFSVHHSPEEPASAWVFRETSFLTWSFMFREKLRKASIIITITLIR